MRECSQSALDCGYIGHSRVPEGQTKIVITFDNRSVLIVGGGSGIGLAAAGILARAGARVLVADIDPGAKSTVAEADASILFLVCDATDLSSVQAMFSEADRLLGGLDHLFVATGGGHIRAFSEFTVDEWDNEFRFNVGSVFLSCQAALPRMAGREGASIVVTSSGYGSIPGPDRVAYTAAKAGVMAMTRSLAAEAAPDGVRVNCIAPGPTNTERFRAMNGGDEGVERVRQQMPLGIIPEPDDVANAAVFLLSDAASQITGQTLHVNGGMIMP